MKKILFTSCILLFANAFAQTYCIPEFDDGCDGGDLIDNFQMTTANFNHQGSGCSTGSYGDFTNQFIILSPGLTYPFTITHDYGSQHVKIWIDFNNDGSFDGATETMSTTQSINLNGVDTSSGNIIVPSSVPVGNYRMRVATRFFNDPIPCNILGYGEAHDYMITIGAPPTCLAPSNTNVSAITTTSATLNWTAPTSTVGLGYEYYLSTTNSAPPVSAVPTGNMPATSTSKNITGLQPSTSYYAWVRTLCTSTDKSAWMSYPKFNTLCGAVVPSYTNDFSTFPGNCWSQALGGSVASGSTTAGSNWHADGFLNSGSTGAAKINLYSLSSTEEVGWLKTNAFNLSAGGYRVKFDYGVTDYSNSDPSAMGSDDYVQFVVSSDGGTTWNVLQTWNTSNSPSNTSSTYILDLPTYTSANTVFAFIGSNGVAVDPEDYEFFIDNFIVESANLSTTEVPNSKNNLKAYPNPFADVLTISDATKVKSVSVIDIAGRVVKTIDNPSSQLQLSELKSGMYMIVLIMNDGSKQTIKAIKK
ncbi:GEVED domain-containing protein [Chryseobacterium sp.]|uniref:GEVED domain-containing protein n=1 Tax=Chryseobacterium sp. TaxID=1871047 RepID=UPI00388F5BD2